MPFPSIPGVSSPKDVKDIAEQLAKMQKYLQWLLQSLDTLNVKELNADIINAGTLNAALVTVRADLTGDAYIEIDGTGMRAYDGSLNTVEINTNGAATLKSVTLRNDLTGGAYVQIDSNGMRAYDGTVNTLEIASDGAATLKKVTIRNDLTGSAYLEIDTAGIRSSDGLINTFEIDTTGKAYFRGDITSDATITGATIRTGAVGTDRIELSGGKFRGINTSGEITGLYFDIGTIAGTGVADIYLYHNDAPRAVFYDDITGFIIRGTSGATFFGLGGTDCPTNCYGDWNFSGASAVAGLITDSDGSHTHGGAVPADGGHSHIVTV